LNSRLTGLDEVSERMPLSLDLIVDADRCVGKMRTNVDQPAFYFPSELSDDDEEIGLYETQK
jgi:hypothetical protein